MTEDMIWEQEKILSQLGTSKEAAAVRAKMQSSSLVSDMEAFKAANPGCLLEDFVRWYSPRDWIEQEDSNDDSCPTSEQDHDQETAGRESPLRIECEQLSDNNEPPSALTGTSDHCVAGHGTVETTDSVTGEGFDSVTGEGFDSVTGEGTDSVTGEGTDSVTVEGFNSVTGEASDGWEHDDWDVIGEDTNQSGVKNEQTTDEYTPRVCLKHLLSICIHCTHTHTHTHTHAHTHTHTRSLLVVISAFECSSPTISGWSHGTLPIRSQLIVRRDSLMIREKLRRSFTSWPTSNPAR